MALLFHNVFKGLLLLGTEKSELCSKGLKLSLSENVKEKGDRQNEKNADTYIHPLCQNEIWVNKLQVLHMIENIQATGKPKLSFKLSDTDQNKIEAAVEMRH